MSFTYTVEDGHAYVTECLEDSAPYFDVPAIAEDLYCQLGTWDLSTVDDEGCGVEFWATVFRHERGAVNMPECPSWCRLGPVHRFDSVEPSGELVGWHEGVLTEVDDQGRTVAVTLG